MTPEMNQSEQKLSSALRELASCSRQGASPELGLALKDEFRRHHARRRRAFRVRITLICLCVTGLAGFFLLKKMPVNNHSARTTVIQTIPPEETTPPTEVNISTARPPALVKHSILDEKTLPTAGKFWALPAFDLVPSGDRLRVVRLQMSGEDLRLVGAPVAEAMVRHRVTADFVVGQDGTPYAVRLVQANF